METTKVTVAEVIKDATDRINTETPPFFERIRGWAKTAAWLAGGIGSVGVVVVTSIASGGIAVPVWVTIGMSILSGLGVLGAGVGVGAAKIANMTTTNEEILSRPSNILKTK
jgi:small-conductance mechanosensitive channel